MVPLSLFSSKLNKVEKRALADRLLAFKPKEPVSSPQHRYATGYGKPSFPRNIDGCTTLADLVHQDSWIIFSLLNIDHSFLVEDVLNWPISAAY